MSTEKIKNLWAVAYDDDKLIVTSLERIVDACHHAFTGAKPIPMTLPVLSVWETEQEANAALEGLRSFEAQIDTD